MNKTYIYRVEWNELRIDYEHDCNEVLQKRNWWLTEERLHSCSAWDGSGSDKNILLCAIVINDYIGEFHSTLDVDGRWWEPVRVEKCEDVLAEAGF